MSNCSIQQQQLMFKLQYTTSSISENQGSSLIGRDINLCTNWDLAPPKNILTLHPSAVVGLEIKQAHALRKQNKTTSFEHLCKTIQHVDSTFCTDRAFHRSPLADADTQLASPQVHRSSTLHGKGNTISLCYNW